MAKCATQSLSWLVLPAMVERSHGSQEEEGTTLFSWVVERLSLVVDNKNDLEHQCKCEGRGGEGGGREDPLDDTQQSNQQQQMTRRDGILLHPYP